MPPTGGSTSNALAPGTAADGTGPAAAPDAAAVGGGGESSEEESAPASPAAAAAQPRMLKREFLVLVVSIVNLKNGPI